MATFTITLRGYDPQNPDAQCLVKRIWAPDRMIFNTWVREAGIRPLLSSELDENIVEVDMEDDSLDVWLAENANAIHGKHVWKFWLNQIRNAQTPPTNVYEGKQVGEYKEHVVYLNDKLFDPKPSLEIVNHSPDGFCWGYNGSGPAQLALAILLEETGDVNLAVDLHTDFMAKHIAVQNMYDRFYMTSERVRKYLATKEG